MKNTKELTEELTEELTLVYKELANAYDWIYCLESCIDSDDYQEAQDMSNEDEPE